MSGRKAEKTGLATSWQALFCAVLMLLSGAFPGLAGPSDEIEAAIRACEFGKAQLMLERRLPDGAEHDSLSERLKWARETEQRARSQILSANRHLDVGDDYGRHGQFQAALFEYEAAREMLHRARQTVECQITRDVIDAMIHLVGKSYMTTEDILSGRWDGEFEDEITLLPVPQEGAHPCLDPDYPVRAEVQYYSTMGIGPGGELRGKFICGLYEDFGVMTASGIELYGCRREGDQFLDCKLWAFDPQTKVRQVEGGTEFHYSRDKTRMMGGEAYWLLVRPK